MSEYEDEFEEFEDPAYEADYTPSPPSPRDQLSEAFFADPVAVTNAVAQAAAQARAAELAAQVGALQGQFHQQTAWAMSEQSAKIADERMLAIYGDDWRRCRADVGRYIEERPYLSNVGLESPQVALDVLNQAYHAIKDETQRRTDAEAWNDVKSAGVPLDGY